MRPVKDRTLIAGMALTTAFLVGLCAESAGAITNPDYANLGDTAPDVTVTELHADGTAHVAFTIPDGAAPQPWRVATYHVPNPAMWHDGQELIDEGPTGLLGPGSYEFTLRTAPGACQLDLWIKGEEQPYSSDTSLEHGWDTCAPPAVEDDVTPESFAISQTTNPVVPVVPVLLSADGTGTSGGGGQETSSVEPAHTGSAPSQPLAAASTLPNTGAGGLVLPAGGLALVAAGTNLLGLGWWKGRRSCA